MELIKIIGQLHKKYGLANYVLILIKKSTSSHFEENYC